MSNHTKILQQANEAVKKAVEQARMRRNEEDRKYILATLGKDLIYLLEPFLHKIAENSRITREDFKKILSEIKIESPQVSVGSPKVEVSTPDVIVPQIVFPEKEMIKAIRRAFAGVILRAPEVKVKVDVPEIKIPKIVVPEAKVTVKVPKIELPEIKVPPIVVPGSSGPRVMRTTPKEEVGVGFEQLAVGVASVGLANIPDNATKAVMTVEDSTLRYRTDGVDPEATIGLQVFRGGVIILNGRAVISKFRAIRIAAPNSELNVNYYEVK